ncbi:MAG: VOC family protein [Thermoplasmatota archaeon]
MPFRYAGIRVRDLRRSIRFYTRALGLKEVGGGTMSHGGKWVDLEDPESKQRLELNWYPRGSKYRAKFVVGEGLDHLGWRVEDARVWYARMLKLGAKRAIAPWDEPPNYTIAFVKDPDGIWIEGLSLRAVPSEGGTGTARGEQSSAVRGKNRGGGNAHGLSRSAAADRDRSEAPPRHASRRAERSREAAIARRGFTEEASPAGTARHTRGRGARRPHRTARPR